MPLRQSVPGLLTCMLLTLLTGCNTDESDTQSNIPLKSAVDQIKTPVALPKNTDKSPEPLPEAVQQAAQPAPVSTVKLVIKATRATDSIDLEALQSGSNLPAPPLQLSVDLVDAPLREVLREIAHKIDAKVSISDDVPDQPITLQLKGVGVTEAIKQILRETNYVLIYKDSPTPVNQDRQTAHTSEAEIAEIRVLPKSTEEETADQTPSLKTLEPGDRTAELEEWKKQALTALNPQDRIKALKQFLEHADPAEHNPVLIAALEDKAPEVRKFALNSMSDSTNPLFEPISQTALNDESPELRTAALDVLVSRYGANAIPVLEQALTDPDTEVQQTAKSRLEMAQRIKSQIDAMHHRQPK